LKINEVTMKRSLVKWMVVCCGVLLVFGSFAVGIHAQDSVSPKTGIAQATEKPPMVPDHKKARWSQLEQRVEEDYKVCIEHCGNDANCMAKCEQVDQAKRDRIYQQLIME
jgi:hypothetical protein